MSPPPAAWARSRVPGWASRGVPRQSPGHQFPRSDLQRVGLHRAKYSDWLRQREHVDVQGEQSGTGELSVFANGLRKDWDAVSAGLTLLYSSGPVEGTITKIKAVNAKCMVGPRSASSADGYSTPTESRRLTESRTEPPLSLAAVTWVTYSVKSLSRAMRRSISCSSGHRLPSTGQTIPSPDAQPGRIAPASSRHIVQTISAAGLISNPSAPQNVFRHETSRQHTRCTISSCLATSL